ncbi:MAG TPA: type II secretion system protein [Burkholderiaceae bacterium]|jgi:type II secretory pathway pseudopilin PulG
MRPGKRASNHRGQRGFTFIAVLLLLALCGLGLAAVGPAWATQSQRDREDELLRIGTLYAQAIAEYRDNSPGSVKVCPDQLQWLVLDTRFVGVARHLRKLYADPMNPGQPWGLIKDQAGHITGVYSLSTQVPLRQQAMDLGALKLDAAQHYSDWKFKPKDPVVASAPGAPTNSSKQIQ